MGIVVGTNSWLTEANADTYFSTRYGADTYWVSGTDKDGALITAYNWLVNCGIFTFPATATQKMKDGQCEMALFLVQHQPDIDLRMGIRSQGVVIAGVVKEHYGNEVMFPIPPIVMGLLEAYSNRKPFHLINLERDEDEGVDYDAYANRETAEE